MEQLQQPFELKTKFQKLKLINEDILHFQVQGNQITSQTKNNENQNKDFLIVLDKSGSMSGAFIENTKKVSQLLLDYLFQNYKTSRINIFTFNTEVQRYENLQQMNSDQMKSIVNNICAEGGTIFRKTFEQIREYILLNKRDNFSLVLLYLTDGQIMSEEDKEEKLMKAHSQLYQAIQNNVKNFEIHTLGIGSEHNPLILDSLMKMKTIRGTYQFIKQSSDIEQSFEAIRDVFSEQSYQFKLFSKLHNAEITLDLNKRREQDQAKQLFYEDSLTIDDIEKQLNIPQGQNKLIEYINKKQIVLKIYQNTDLIQTCEVSLDDQYNKQQGVENQMEDEQEMQEILQIIRNNLNKHLNVLKETINKKQKIDIKQLQEFEGFIKRTKGDMENIILQIFKIKGSLSKCNDSDVVKNSLFQQAAEIQERLEKGEQLQIQLCKGQIKNDLIAEVNSLACANIQTKLYQKNVQKRYKASLQQFNDYKVLIAQFSLQYQQQIKQLRIKYEQQIGLYGQCFLTQYDMIEAICEQDCLCLTFSAIRSEFSIVRPEHVHIIDIFPTVISAKSFLSAVSYSLKICPQNSGEFMKKEGLIVKGVAQEQINAALPLFINNEHWQIAKLWQEPILGWVTTLDIMGYVHSQKRTIPFSLLQKAYLNYYLVSKSEFNLKILNDLRDTCKAIMEDVEFDKQQLKIEESNGLPFIQETKTQLQELLNTNILFIDPDKYINIDIILMKYILAVELGWIDTPEQQEGEVVNKTLELFTFRLIEEQLRRKFQAKYWSNQDLQKLMNIEDENENTLQQAKQKYNEFIIEHCQGILTFYFLYVLKQNTDKLALEIKKGKDGNLIQFINLPNLNAFKCLFVQNIIQSSNKSRQSAIEQKQYCYPWTQYDQFPEKFNQELQKIIEEKKQKQLIKQQQSIGTFVFPSPIVRQKILNLTNQLIMESKQDQWENQILELKKHKQNSHWYFWLLVSNKAIELNSKLIFISKNIGKPKLTNYNKYVLNKANYNIEFDNLL